jgi:uncharacterized protein with HEPN domain
VPTKRPAVRIPDILDNIGRIRSHTAGLTEAAFINDLKTQDAVERCLGRISEAAVKLGEAAERLAPSVRWDEIRAFGNRLRHCYDTIRPSRIWLIVRDDLDSLEAACQSALAKLAGNEGNEN